MKLLKLGLVEGKVVLLDKNNEELPNQFRLKLEQDIDSLPIVTVSFYVDTKDI